MENETNTDSVTQTLPACAITQDHRSISTLFLENLVYLLNSDDLRLKAYSIDDDYSSILVESAKYIAGGTTISVQVTKSR